MGAAKQLGLIAAGYALALGVGLGAVSVNEWLMPPAISETSGGMVAFGDVVIFLLAAGSVSLAPTWFLLRLFAERAPRALLMTELAIAATGPISWLAVLLMTAVAGPSHPLPVAAAAIGAIVAFAAIPRIVLGPIALVVEAASLLLLRTRQARGLLAAAMLMEVVPMVLFALHMAGAMLRYGQGRA